MSMIRRHTNPSTRSMNLSFILLGLALGTIPATAQVIADFSAEFPTPEVGPAFAGTESPSTGWNYLWNPDGVVGVAANYQSLLPNTVTTWPGFGGVSPMFTNLGDVAFNSTAQGNFRFGRISLTSIHGSGQVPGTGDYRAIVAYTIQAGEEGHITIANSSYAKLVATASNGVDIDIYVNDTLRGALSKDGFNSLTATDFNGSLGNLAVGDTVYITVGDNNDPNNDAGVIDFQLVSGPVIGYGPWATSNLVLEGEDGDDDKDGILNLVEYALGLDPQAGNPAPGTFIGNTMSFTKGPGPKEAYDLTFKIQTSTTLEAGSWSDAAATETLNGISFTLPPGEPGGKLFGRLLVTRP
jgi:hypothetical protein